MSAATPSQPCSAFHRRTFQRGLISVEIHKISAQPFRFFSPTVVHYLQHFSDRYHLMLSPGTGAPVNISVSHSLQQQLLHTKKLHGLIGVGSGAGCVGCAGGLVRFTRKLRHSSAADREAPEQPVKHILILTQFFSRQCYRLECNSSLPTLTLQYLSVFTVSYTCVMHL